MVIQCGAIRQIGQRIVAGEVQDPLLGADAIGHVEGHGDAGIPILVAQRPRLDRDMDHPALGRDMAAGISRGLVRLVPPELTVQGLRPPPDTSSFQFSS